MQIEYLQAGKINTSNLLTGREFHITNSILTGRKFRTSRILIGRKICKSSILIGRQIRTSSIQTGTKIRTSSIQTGTKIRTSSISDRQRSDRTTTKREKPAHDENVGHKSPSRSHRLEPKLQALVYDILPSTAAVFS